MEKSFDAYVIEHLGLNALFGSLGWEPFLYISKNYYPEFAREFYANMLHITDKDLFTILSTVKGVRIVLDRKSLASILGFRHERNNVTVDSNKKIH